MSELESNVSNEVQRPVLNGNEFVGFGYAELSYLLARYSGDAVEKSRDMLSLSPPSSEVTSAGASSLLARDFMRVSGDDLELVGLPAVFAHTLATAVRWTQIGLVVDAQDPSASVDGALYVQSVDAAIIMQPRVLGTWFVLVQAPEVSPEEAIFTVVESFLSDSRLGSVFLGSDTASTSQAMFVRRLANSNWQVAEAPRDGKSATVEVTGDPADVLQRLSSLLAIDSPSA